MDRRLFIKKFLSAGIGATLIASYPLVFERYLIRENHYKVVLKDLPREFTGFRILQLTDLHYGFLAPRILMEYVISRANAIEKDVTVCTGDYVHKKRSTKEIDTVWPLLKRLNAPLGVYSVLGNHDHWVDSEHSLYWLEKSGQSLRNKVIPIERNGKRIWLGGCGDIWEDDLMIDETFSGVKPSDFKILLAHNPDTADREYKTRVNLFISGHTHGGQVNLPLMGPILLPVQNKRFTSGLIHTERTSVFISKGIGWAVVPVRFNCSPEIAVLHLYP